MEKDQKKTQNIRIALDNVRSAHNVGSIFRTAEGAGVEHLYLIGYTPAPTDRFGRAQPDIKKTALGAEEMVPWTHIETYDGFLEEMRSCDVYIVAVEQGSEARSYVEVSKEKDVVFIFGNEVDGVSEELLRGSNEVVELPMYGKKESLNVSVATGIVLYQQRL